MSTDSKAACNRSIRELPFESRIADRRRPRRRVSQKKNYHGRTKARHPKGKGNCQGQSNQQCALRLFPIPHSHSVTTSVCRLSRNRFIGDGLYRLDRVHRTHFFDNWFGQYDSCPSSIRISHTARVSQRGTISDHLYLLFLIVSFIESDIGFLQIARSSLGKLTGKKYHQEIGDQQLILLDLVRKSQSSSAMGMLRAGPRRNIVWKTGEVKAAIVTAGGLCPGLNSVICELTNMLFYNCTKRKSALPASLSKSYCLFGLYSLDHNRLHHRYHHHHPKHHHHFFFFHYFLFFLSFFQMV